MDNKLQIRKIYIDSRFKTAGSRSNSDFYIDLPESISIPNDIVCFVDNVVIPNSWKTIDSYNNKLYVKRTSTGAGVINTYKIITLTENNYSATTLRTELQTQLNNEFDGTDCTVTYDQVLLRYSIDTNLSNVTIRFFTDSELINSTEWTDYGGPAYNKSDLNSANEVLSIFETQQAKNI